MPPNPRVFISYSHDDDTHRARVLAFAQALRTHGAIVELDQYHSTSIVHWPVWCRQQMAPEQSDFVLCICTAEYRRRIEGNVPPEQGKGVYWEGTLMHCELYDGKGNRRFIPVLFDDEAESSIVETLRGWSFCRIGAFELTDSGYELLYRILTKQASVEPAPVGPLVALPTERHTGSPLAAASAVASAPPVKSTPPNQYTPIPNSPTKFTPAVPPEFFIKETNDAYELFVKAKWIEFPTNYHCTYAAPKHLNKQIIIMLIDSLSICYEIVFHMRKIHYCITQYNKHREKSDSERQLENYIDSVELFVEFLNQNDTSLRMLETKFKNAGLSSAFECFLFCAPPIQRHANRLRQSCNLEHTQIVQGFLSCANRVARQLTTEILTAINTHILCGDTNDNQ